MWTMGWGACCWGPLMLKEITQQFRPLITHLKQNQDSLAAFKSLFFSPRAAGERQTWDSTVTEFQKTEFPAREVSFPKLGPPGKVVGSLRLAVKLSGDTLENCPNHSAALGSQSPKLAL